MSVLNSLHDQKILPPILRFSVANKNSFTGFDPFLANASILYPTGYKTETLARNRLISLIFIHSVEITA